MLDRSGFQPGADLRQHGRARRTLGAIGADLDQFVCLETAIHLGQDGGAEALLADAGDGVERVGAGAQGAAQG